MDNRKELKEKYKNMKADMGVYIIKSNSSDKYFVEASQNLKAAINRTNFTLELGSHINKELQALWNKLGKRDFTIEILEKLQYDEDETKVDYTEELNILKMIWEEKLTKEKP